MSLSLSKTTRPNTLIVFALETETQGLFGDTSHIHCGIGKVNAAYGLTRALADWRHKNGAPPALVLNLGSAGSPRFAAGSTINCTRFIQRDMDTTALGTAPYATLFEDGPHALANGLRFLDWAEGICGSGDNFVTHGRTDGWDVVDMEAYALAKVCLREKVPFGCLKFITDGADGQAATSWEAALADAARALRQAMEEVTT